MKNLTILTIFEILTTLILVSLAGSQSFAGDYCRDVIGLPQCGTVPPGNHCCVDITKIPPVRCYGRYYPVKDSQGRWSCGAVPTGRAFPAINCPPFQNGLQCQLIHDQFCACH